VDVLITPDFNVTLVGPGAYHFAIGVSKKGDTCVRPLAGNASEISLSELLGTATYKTGFDEAAIFPGGKIDGHTTLSAECGCPPVMPVRLAEVPPPPPPPAPPRENAASKPEERVAVASSAPAPAVPPDRPGQVHVEVDTPFVFSARSSAARPYSVAKLQVSSLPNVFFMQEAVDPVVLTDKAPEVSPKADLQQPKADVQQPQPAEKPEKEKKGFLGRIKGFFGSLFHR
jgi:hypothetical protein